MRMSRHGDVPADDNVDSVCHPEERRLALGTSLRRGQSTLEEIGDVDGAPAEAHVLLLRAKARCLVSRGYPVVAKAAVDDALTRFGSELEPIARLRLAVHVAFVSIVG